MNISRFYTRVLPVLMFALILGAAAFAFADANVVDPSGAGDGSAAISGYNITAIRYTLNTTTPTNVDSVQFTVTPIAGASAPTVVKVQLNGAGSWFACSLVSGTNWSCALTGVTAVGATDLRVVAAQ